MKRVLGYALVGVFAYLVFLLLQFPATALLGLLAPPGLTLQARQVEGTALSGQARGLRLGGGEWGELAWRWQPAGLLGGRLEYRLRARDGSHFIEALAGLDWQRRWQIRELHGRLPLGRVVRLAGSPPPPLDGGLELNLAELHLDAAGRPLTARGSVRLAGAHSRLGQPLMLGSFVAQSAGDGPPLAAEVRDEGGGPVELSGRFQLAADGRYRFDGRLGLHGSADPALRQALELLLGPPAADGRWPLDLAGALPL